MIKKYSVLFLALFSLQFVACANKDNSPNKSYKGRNNMSAQYGAGQTSQGQSAGSPWDNFANSPIALINASPDQLSQFVSQSYNGTMGSIAGGTIEMQLIFNGGSQLSPSSRLGIMIWDSLALQYVQPPFSAYEGPEVSGGSISGSLNGNHITATFSDAYGSITIDGYASSSGFQGQIAYSNGGVLGTFSLPTQGVIFQ